MAAASYEEEGAMRNAEAPASLAYSVGEIDVIVVADGDRTSPVAEGFVLNAAIDEVRSAYRAHGIPEGHGNTPFNPTVIRTGAKTVLVDTGVGADVAEEPGATAGFLMRNLAAVGIGPNDVDMVVISHFHGDHVGGLVSPDGRAAFPRAEISVPANEWSFWMDDDERARATPGRMQWLFENSRQIFDPLRERVQTHAWDEEVVPGVTAVGTPGHSIGHTSYLIQSQGERVFLIQDVSNHPALSLEHPGWHLAFDQDPVAAEVTRRRTLDWLAREQLPVQGFHFPFPGRAHVEAVGDAYRAVPIS
jgi:glyoxylase-like metal-dependent hydrolase (beta-lactamase superfamily II)